jgi:intracellular sulfur oxidation DsrE/DsrF family protein
MPQSNDRRRFLSRVAALGATLGLVSPRLATAATSREASPTDDPWISRLRGPHRVVFHSHLPTDGLAVRWAQTYLDTQQANYGLRDADSSVVVGLNGRSIGWFFGDALWARYPTVGEIMGAPGSRNPQTALLAGLRARGVILLACGNSIRASGQRFLPPAQQADAAARTAFADEVRAALLPGVDVVPSMVVTLQQAQDRGCRYIYAGG